MSRARAVVHSHRSGRQLWGYYRFLPTTRLRACHYRRYTPCVLGILLDDHSPSHLSEVSKLYMCMRKASMFTEI